MIKEKVEDGKGNISYQSRPFFSAIKQKIHRKIIFIHEKEKVTHRVIHNFGDKLGQKGTKRNDNIHQSVESLRRKHFSVKVSVGRENIQKQKILECF